MSAEARRQWTELAERTRVTACKRSGNHATTRALEALAGVAVTKLRNRATVVDGIRFPSKLQADRYRELKLLVAAGKVLYFVREVPFDVGGGVVYRADFVVVWNLTGPPATVVTVEDTKGHLTETSRVKIAVVQERYGIKVRLLRRGDVSR